MATQYPVIINSIALLINPRQLDLTKSVAVGQLDTQNGRQFQVWYDQPDTLTITGRVYGSKAYSQLFFMKQHYEGFETTSTLYYKTRSYRGFVSSLNVSANVDPSPYVWTYTLTFQLLFGERFRVEDFSLLPETAGPVARGINSFITGIQNKINAKISGFVARQKRSIDKAI